VDAMVEIAQTLFQHLSPVQGLPFFLPYPGLRRGESFAEW